MKTLFSYTINRSCAYFALWIFILGQLLFLLYLATEAEIIIGAGIVFMSVFIVLTPVALITLLLNALTNLRDLRQHLTAIFMVLLNIPIAILYINLIMNF